MHLFPLRVYYEDTDFSGFVYHANFLKFCERARSEMIRQAGVDQNQMFASGQAIVIRHMACDFLKPAKFDDELTVESHMVAAKGARMEMTQRVLRKADVLFEAQVTAAIIDRNGRPLRLPPAFLAAFEKSNAR
jgi:acyl-CoA thioester hydrolase